MGLPASPPVTSEESEADGDSPPPHISTTSVPPAPAVSIPPASTLPPQQSQPPQHQPQPPVQQPSAIPIPIQPQPEQQSAFNPQLITIDERTLQLHFTPLYFGKNYIIITACQGTLISFLFPELLDAMANIKNNNEYLQLTNSGLF